MDKVKSSRKQIEIVKKKSIRILNRGFKKHTGMMIWGWWWVWYFCFVVVEFREPFYNTENLKFTYNVMFFFFSTMITLFRPLVASVASVSVKAPNDESKAASKAAHWCRATLVKVSSSRFDETNIRMKQRINSAPTKCESLTAPDSSTKSSFLKYFVNFSLISRKTHLCTGIVLVQVLQGVTRLKDYRLTIDRNSALLMHHILLLLHWLVFLLHRQVVVVVRFFYFFSRFFLVRNLLIQNWGF